MKILNLDIDDMHLRSRYTEDGFEMVLGEKIPLFSNKIILSNRGNNFSDQSHLDCEFDLCEVEEYVGSNYYKLHTDIKTYANIDANRLEKEGLNVLFTGVYSKDCESIVESPKILGDIGLINKIKVLALGLTNSIDCSSQKMQNAVLLMPSGCDYTLGGLIYSGRTGCVIKKSKHKNSYNLSDICINALNS